MSDRLVVRAPGKLFVLGEYAVLDGCPAIVAAVDRSVDVRVSRSSSAFVRIHAAELGASVEFRPDDPSPTNGPLRFAISAFRAVSLHLSDVRRTSLDIEITSNLDAGSGAKVGLGGSAAVTVAMVAGLFAVTGKDLSDLCVREQMLAIAFAAHRDAQAGVGSGADVAASCYGGLVCVEPSPGVAPRVRPLMLPVDATLLAGWTGEAASTPGLVQRYLGASNGSAATRAAFVQQTRGCVEMFRKALSLRLVSSAALNRAGDLLQALGNDLDLPLLTPGLRDLIALARTQGAGAKLSGAGGGDCGIALTQQSAAAARIRAAWRSAGIVPLDLRIDPQGVRIAKT